MSFLSNHRPEVLEELNGRAAYVPTAADLAEMARHHALANIDLSGLDRLAKSLDGVAAGCHADGGAVSDNFHRGFCNGEAMAYEAAARWLRTEIEALKN